MIALSTAISEDAVMVEPEPELGKYMYPVM